MLVEAPRAAVRRVSAVVPEPVVQVLAAQVQVLAVCAAVVPGLNAVAPEAGWSEVARAPSVAVRQESAEAPPGWGAVVTMPVASVVAGWIVATDPMRAASRTGMARRTGMVRRPGMVRRTGMVSRIAAIGWTVTAKAIVAARPTAT
ncbi:hypothetical protein AIGOOFII_3961 [Methylobacterium marchantiae]|nr:hypothetical protein AIGOOFII_3961 [Methylobacterium marchantiae]